MEGKRRGKGGTATLNVAEQEAIGLDGVGGEQEATDGNIGEVIGFFEHGWLGMASFGRAVASNETGDVERDETLVEV